MTKRVISAEIKTAAVSDELSTSSDTELTVSDIYYRLHNEKVGRILALAPIIAILIGFIPIIILIYLLQYDERYSEFITTINCTAIDFVPSMKMFVSQYPLSVVWKCGIALHCAPRIAAGFMYSSLFTQLTNNTKLVRLHFWVYYLELTVLLTVSYITEVDHDVIHHYSRVMLLVATFLHVGLTLLIFTLYVPKRELTKPMKTGLYWKKVSVLPLLVGTIGRIIASTREDTSCYGENFDRFAIFEYLIVIASMMFHYTFVHDFSGGYFINCKILEVNGVNQEDKEDKKDK